MVGSYLQKYVAFPDCGHSIDSSTSSAQTQALTTLLVILQVIQALSEPLLTSPIGLKNAQWIVHPHGNITPFHSHGSHHHSLLCSYSTRSSPLCESYAW